MAIEIKLKHSSTAGKKPAVSDLVAGEVAINTADEVAYIKNASGAIVPLTGSGSLSSYPDVTDGDGATLDARYVKVVGDDMTGDLTLGTDKITLNATNGSIAAAGDILSGDYDVSDASTQGVFLGSGGAVRAQRASGASADNANFSNYLGTTQNWVVRGDGTQQIGGTINTGIASSSPNITLSASGGATFSNIVQVSRDATGDSSVVGFNAIQGGVSKGFLRYRTAGDFLLTPTGSVSDTHFGVDVDGNVRICSGTGNYPASPNISLNADGTASFGTTTAPSDTNFGTFVGRGGNKGLLESYRNVDKNFPVLHFGGTQGAATIKGDGSLEIDGGIAADGDVLIGGTLPASPNISLKADGTATFAGNVQVGKDPRAGSYTGAMLQSVGVFQAARDVSNATVIETYLTANNGTTSNATCKITAGGSATLAGSVVLANPNTGSNTGNGIRLNVNPVAKTSTILCQIDGTVANPGGQILFRGLYGTSETSAINADGSATFKGNVTATVVPPSDQKFKENITPANPQLADVVALGKQLKNFNWNDDAPLNDELRTVRQLGLIAQEAEKVSPGIVKTIKRTKQGKELTPEQVIPAVYRDVVDPQDEESFTQELVTPEQTIPATYEIVDDSFKGISHDALIMKLLGAVAELSAEVEALKAPKTAKTRR